VNIRKNVRTICDGLIIVAGLFVLGGMAFLYGNYTETDNMELSLNKVVDVSGKKVEVASDNSGNGGESSMTNKVGEEDSRLLLIKKYLSRYKSPLLPYSDLILKLSDENNFEYYWILAIGQQESNLCKKIPDDSYNCWGYGIHKSGTLRFGSYEEALTSYANYLRTEYFEKGYKTPDEIMQKYCPSSNGSWSEAVSHIIGRIERGSF